jgi:hypothetical protein
MEEDIITTLKEANLPKNKSVELKLENAVAQAQEILDFESAHNVEIVHALNIVKNFIIKKKRVCYGGTAMNALLPKKDKFYDPNYNLPDYDFLTPNLESDIKDLVTDLENGGFKDVYHRVGVHEGTKKVLVNYVPIADLTYVNQEIYNIFLKESKVINKLHYTNEHMLRMMMYLELSRPRGEVERWKKVYERLNLINNNFNFISCKKKHFLKEVPFELRKEIFNFVVQKQRILINLEVEGVYKNSLANKKVIYSLRKGGPLIFYSPDIKRDAYDLKQVLRLSNLKIMFYSNKSDYLPERIRIIHNNKTLAVIIEENACISYNSIETENKQIMLIGSLETIIHAHYMLFFFTKSEKSFLCKIGNCIETLDKLRKSKISQFPSFTITCSGYQKGYPTLLREKVIRIKKEKTKKEIKKKNITIKKK